MRAAHGERAAVRQEARLPVPALRGTAPDVHAADGAFMTLTVITGPPCAGKTRYAREHAAPGDLVIDFDALAAALGSQAGHGHGAWLARVTAAAWSAAVTRAVREHAGHRAWVIDASPSPARLAAYRRAGARMAALGAEEGELHRRAREAGRPEQAHRAIDEWGKQESPRYRGTVTGAFLLADDGNLSFRYRSASRRSRDRG